MTLVEIKKGLYNIILDLRYASKNNITGKKIFLENKCFLHTEAAQKLKEASTIANNMGFYLKIFDAYRPKYVQKILWEFEPNPSFLSNPDKGSPHTKGIAVDLTLTDKNEKELFMGTDFDDFTSMAFHLSVDIAKEAIINRRLLLSIMALAGFDHYLNEWWHYQLYEPGKYPLIDNYFA